MGIAHDVLRKALNDAVRWQLLARNPASVVRPPRAPRRELLALTRLSATASTPMFEMARSGLVPVSPEARALARLLNDSDYPEERKAALVHDWIERTGEGDVGIPAEVVAAMLLDLEEREASEIR